MNPKHGKSTKQCKRFYMSLLITFPKAGQPTVTLSVYRDVLFVAAKNTFINTSVKSNLLCYLSFQLLTVVSSVHVKVESSQQDSR